MSKVTLDLTRQRRPSNPTPSRISPTKISPKKTPSLISIDPRSPPTSPKGEMTTRNDFNTIKWIKYKCPKENKLTPSKKKSKTKYNQDRLRAVVGMPTYPHSTSYTLNLKSSLNAPLNFNEYNGKQKQISIDHINISSNPRVNLAAHAHKSSPSRSTTNPKNDEFDATKTSVTNNSKTGDLLEKTRMASALNKLGINMGPEVLEHWMNHGEYDGVSFGSMAVLYEVKLTELLSTIPRTTAKGNYPNKVRTALVLGIFKELASSNALGKFKPLLESLLSTVIDGIYVDSVRNYSNGKLLNSSDYGRKATWYEMAHSQVDTIQKLNIELKKADILKKRFKADKIMQQHLLKRTINRWKKSITALVFKTWSNYYKNKKRTMNMINSMMKRKFVEKKREILRRCWIAWMAYTRSIYDQRLNQDGWSDLDSKEQHEKEIATLTEQRDESLYLLKQMIIDFKIQLFELKNMFKLQLDVIISKQTIDISNLIESASANSIKKEMTSVSTQVGSTGNDAINGNLSENCKGTNKMITKEKIPEKIKKKKKKKVYKGRTLTLNKVLDIIAGMWEKKIRADIIDDAANKDRDSLAEFAVDFFVQMYGSVMKKKKMDEFKHSIQVHRNNHVRVKWFSTMIGWNDDYAFGIYTPFHEKSSDAFLQVLSELFPIDSIEERLDDDPCLVQVTAALKALGTDGDGLFDLEYRRTTKFSDLIKLFNSNSQSVKGKAASEKYIDFDLCINAVLNAWYTWKVPQPSLDKVNDKASEEKEEEITDV
jgi:hypothetical protein